MAPRPAEPVEPPPRPRGHRGGGPFGSWARRRVEEDAGEPVGGDRGRRASTSFDPPVSDNDLDLPASLPSVRGAWRRSPTWRPCSRSSRRPRKRAEEDLDGTLDRGGGPRRRSPRTPSRGDEEYEASTKTPLVEARRAGARRGSGGLRGRGGRGRGRGRGGDRDEDGNPQLTFADGGLRTPRTNPRAKEEDEDVRVRRRGRQPRRHLLPRGRRLRGRRGGRVRGGREEASDDDDEEADEEDRADEYEEEDEWEETTVPTRPSTMERTPRRRMRTRSPWSSSPRLRPPGPIRDVRAPAHRGSSPAPSRPGRGLRSPAGAGHGVRRGLRDPRPASGGGADRPVQGGKKRDILLSADEWGGPLRPLRRSAPLDSPSHRPRRARFTSGAPGI